MHLKGHTRTLPWSTTVSRAQTEVAEAGFLARANHSVFGLIDNAGVDSVRRYEHMSAFLGDLWNEFADLDAEEVLARCREVLRQPSILRPTTRSSFVIDVRAQRVDYVVGDGPWETFGMGEAVAGPGLPA